MSAMTGVIAAALMFFVALFQSSARADDLIWGVNGHPFTAYPGIEYDAQLDEIRDLGLTTYRVNISSLDQSDRLAKLLSLAKPRGIRILPVLTPPVDLAGSPPETIYSQAKAFAAYFVSRFKSEIKVWELGNELEVFAIIKACEMRDDGTQYNCAWGPAGGVWPLDYYGPRWAKSSAALKGLSDGTQTADPTALKAMGTAGWGHVGAFARMKADGIEWDISVWHMYGEDPEWAFKAIAEFGKPIWVTELNHPHGSQRGRLEQAQGLQRSMARLRELRGTYRVEAAQLYELLDEPYWAPSFEAFMGLVELEKSGGGWKIGARKPAHCVVWSMTRSLAADAARGCDPCLFPPLGKSASDKTTYSYCLLLSRSPDGQGLRDWSASLERGGRIEDILISIMQSDEFRDKHELAQKSNSDYVTLVYKLLLGREPDGQGRSDYVSQLDSGKLSRADLARSAIYSDEFRSKHAVFF
jgi:hypothetical protein